MNRKIIILSIICLSFIALVLLYVNVKITKNVFRSSQKSSSNNFINEKNNRAIPETNLKWLENLGLLQKGVLVRIVITTTAKGQVFQISEKAGVVADGDYYYLKKLALQGENGSRNAIYFSPHRVAIMKIYEEPSGKPINFSEINIGDFVEIEESLDLLRPNYNDENVLYLMIKVYKRNI